MMEIDDNEESAVKTAVKKQSGTDGRFFAILTSIPDVMHRIKDMLIQPEKQQNDRYGISMNGKLRDVENQFVRKVPSKTRRILML